NGNLYASTLQLSGDRLLVSQDGLPIAQISTRTMAAVAVAAAPAGAASAVHRRGANRHSGSRAGAIIGAAGMAAALLLAAGLAVRRGGSKGPARGTETGDGTDRRRVLKARLARRLFALHRHGVQRE